MLLVLRRTHVGVFLCGMVDGDINRALHLCALNTQLIWLQHQLVTSGSKLLACMLSCHLSLSCSRGGKWWKKCLRQYSNLNRIKMWQMSSKQGSDIMKLLARLFLLMQVFYLPFKFLTETANCATVVGLYFKIAPLLINSLSLFPAGYWPICVGCLEKVLSALHMLCETIKKMWKPIGFVGAILVISL